MLAERRQISLHYAAIKYKINKKYIFKGIWDNVSVKRSSIIACHSIATHLLEVDEVIRAGINIKTGQ